MPIKKILILNRFRLIDSFCLFVYLFIFLAQWKKEKEIETVFGAKLRCGQRMGLLYIFRLGF